jgi:hypothetical protein
LGQRVSEVLGSGPSSLGIFLAGGCLGISGYLKEAVSGRVRTILSYPVVFAAH